MARLLEEINSCEVLTEEEFEVSVDRFDHAIIGTLQNVRERSRDAASQNEDIQEWSLSDLVHQIRCRPVI